MQALAKQASTVSTMNILNSIHQTTQAVAADKHAELLELDSLPLDQQHPSTPPVHFSGQANLPLVNETELRRELDKNKPAPTLMQKVLRKAIPQVDVEHIIKTELWNINLQQEVPKLAKTQPKGQQRVYTPEFEVFEQEFEKPAHTEISYNKFLNRNNQTNSANLKN